MVLIPTCPIYPYTSVCQAACLRTWAGFSKEQMAVRCLTTICAFEKSTFLSAVTFPWKFTISSKNKWFWQSLNNCKQLEPARYSLTLHATTFKIPAVSLLALPLVSTISLSICETFPGKSVMNNCRSKQSLKKEVETFVPCTIKGKHYIASRQKPKNLKKKRQSLFSGFTVVFLHITASQNWKWMSLRHAVIQKRNKALIAIWHHVFVYICDCLSQKPDFLFMCRFP